MRTTDRITTNEHRPLELAAVAGDLATVTQILGTDASLIAETHARLTPEIKWKAFILAIKHNHSEVALELINVCDDASTKDYLVALALAAKHQEQDVADRLACILNTKASFCSSDPSAFLVACQYGEVYAVKKFIEAGIDVNSRLLDEGGASALMLAFAGGHVGVVQLLVAAGVDIDAAIVEQESDSPEQDVLFRLLRTFCFARGSDLYNRGQYEEAIVDFTTAIDINRCLQDKSDTADSDLRVNQYIGLASVGLNSERNEAEEVKHAEELRSGGIILDVGLSDFRDEFASALFGGYDSFRRVSQGIDPTQALEEVGDTAEMAVNILDLMGESVSSLVPVVGNLGFAASRYLGTKALEIGQRRFVDDIHSYMLNVGSDDESIESFFSEVACRITKRYANQINKLTMSGKEYLINYYLLPCAFDEMRKQEHIDSSLGDAEEVRARKIRALVLSPRNRTPKGMVKLATKEGRDRKWTAEGMMTRSVINVDGSTYIAKEPFEGKVLASFKRKNPHLKYGERLGDRCEISEETHECLSHGERGFDDDLFLQSNLPSSEELPPSVSPIVERGFFSINLTGYERSIREHMSELEDKALDQLCSKYDDSRAAMDLVHQLTSIIDEHFALQESERNDHLQEFHVAVRRIYRDAANNHSMNADVEENIFGNVTKVTKAVGKHLVNTSNEEVLIREKIAVMNEYATTNFKDVHPGRYNEACRVVKEFTAATDRHYAQESDKQDDNIGKYRRAIRKTVNEAKNSPLAEHRGWKKVVYNVLAVVFSGGLSLIYFAYKARLGGGSFLLNPATESMNKAEDVEKVLPPSLGGA